MRGRVVFDKMTMTMTVSPGAGADPATPFPHRQRRGPNVAARGAVRVVAGGEPVPDPGLAFMDIVTGFEAYVAAAPEQMEGAVRWSCWWARSCRSTAPGAPPPRSPRLTHRGRPDGRVRADARLRWSAALPGARRARPDRSAARSSRTTSTPMEARPDPDGARLASKVVGVMLPFLLAQQLERRSHAPMWSNFDGETISLVKARDRRPRRDRVTEALEEHPIRPGTDEKPAVDLAGRDPPAGQAAGDAGELKAQLGAESDIDPDYTPRRIRGTVVVDGDELRVEVDSRQRLDHLLVKILAGLGAEPTVMDQSSFDPPRTWPGRPALYCSGAVLPRPAPAGKRPGSMRACRPCTAVARSPAPRSGRCWRDCCASSSGTRPRPAGQATTSHGCGSSSTCRSSDSVARRHAADISRLACAP